VSDVGLLDTPRERADEEGKKKRGRNQGAGCTRKRPRTKQRCQLVPGPSKFPCLVLPASQEGGRRGKKKRSTKKSHQVPDLYSRGRQLALSLSGSLSWSAQKGRGKEEGRSSETPSKTRDRGRSSASLTIATGKRKREKGGTPIRGDTRVRTFWPDPVADRGKRGKKGDPDVSDQDAPIRVSVTEPHPSKGRGKGKNKGENKDNDGERVSSTIANKHI